MKTLYNKCAVVFDGMVKIFEHFWEMIAVAMISLIIALFLPVWKWLYVAGAALVIFFILLFLLSTIQRKMKKP